MTFACIRGVKSRGERKGAENLFKGVIAENFPNLGKETNIQVQEAKRALNKMNTRRATSRHIIIKMANIKDKDRVFKGAREKQKVI